MARSYTLQDYVDAFDGSQTGFVGVDRDGDLVHVPHQDIEWKYRTIVLDFPTLQEYRGRMPMTKIIETDAIE